MTSNPLSSFNTALELQERIADGLNQSEELSSLGINVLCEDILDIEFQINKAIKQQGICTIVMTPKIDYMGHKGDYSDFDFPEIIIQTVEYVPVNRALNKQVASTALDVSQYILDYMTSPSSPFGFGSFGAIGVELGEDNGLLVSQAKIKTYMTRQETNVNTQNGN